MFEKEAEEYVNGIPIFADEGEGFSRTQMQQSFLDGLEAGRPKWHDLRKDPKDLPKEHEYVLVYTDLSNYYVSERVNDHFMTKGFGFIPTSTVIAWCEIPKYTEE